jgi:hypothetical protein
MLDEVLFYKLVQAASSFRTLMALRPNLRIWAKTVRNETKPCETETPRRSPLRAVARGLASRISGSILG